MPNSWGDLKGCTRLGIGTRLQRDFLETAGTEFYGLDARTSGSRFHVPWGCLRHLEMNEPLATPSTHAGVKLTKYSRQLHPSHISGGRLRARSYSFQVSLCIQATRFASRGVLLGHRLLHPSLKSQPPQCRSVFALVVSKTKRERERERQTDRVRE